MPGYAWALPKLWPGAQGTKTYMTYAGKNCPWNYHVKNKNNKHWTYKLPTPSPSLSPYTFSPQNRPQISNPYHKTDTKATNASPQNRPQIDQPLTPLPT